MALQQQMRQFAFHQAQFQAMMDARNRGLDIRAQGLADRRVAPYVRALADPNNNDYFDRNPDIAAHYHAIAGGHVDPVTGPGYDPNSNTLHLGNGRSYGESDTGAPPPGGPGAGPPGSHGPAPGGPGPAPPPTSPPSLSLPGGISGVGLAGAAGPGPQLSMPPSLAGVGEAPPPPMPNLGPGLTMPPSVQGMGAPPQFALGGVTPHPPLIGPPVPGDILNRQAGARVAAAGAPPDSPTPAPSPEVETGAPPAPAEPQTLAQKLRAKFLAGPGPHQTDRKFRDDIVAEAKIAGIDLREVMTGAMVPYFRARSKESDVNAALGVQRGLEEPTKFASNIAHTEAGTENLRAATAATRALTPERIATLQHDRAAKDQQLKISASNLQRSWADLQEKIRNNTASLAERKRMDDATIGYRKAATDKIQNILDNGDALKMAAPDKAALQQHSHIYNAGHNDSISGAWEWDFPDPVRAASLQAMNGILGKYKQNPIVDPLAPSRGGTASPAVGGTMGPAHSSVSAPVVQSKASPAEVAAMKQMMREGSVHTHLSQATPAQAQRMRTVFQQMNGRIL